MNNRNLMVKAYARSLFQNGLTFSQNNESNKKLILSNILIIGEELTLLRALFLNSVKLRCTFENPTFPETQKLDILFSLFPEMSLVMHSFLEILAEKSQLDLISNICEEYHDILFKFNAVTKVKLHLAGALDESFGGSFLLALKKLTSSKEIIIQAIFNSKLLGGFIIEYNSKAVNATFLYEISRHL